jgi:hypothetical protein
MTQNVSVAQVVYHQPNFKDLQRRFDVIDQDYIGRTFRAVEPCRDVVNPWRNCFVGFQYFRLEKNMPTVGVFEEMGGLGVRPALHEELLAFDREYPDEQRHQRRIVGLGSATVRSYRRGRASMRRVACLVGSRSVRSLVTVPFQSIWTPGESFLVVPL